jgi:hypothetical protein
MTPPLRLLRLANPAVRAILGSPAHRLLSGRLVVVSYQGHRSGRSFRIPLRYAVSPDGRFVALAVRPEEKLWWRSFTEPASATLTVRRRRIEARGVLTEGEARERALAVYVARFPRSAHLVREAAIVEFTPEH